ncbi:Co2+/Mg2+ efflux protein ApaG [Aestuariibacter sp. GS-14]|uniref:Co2+/Mg2+ efflux protein ApaG n=1 Tax=Alteromonadaceae TaxID=72275 RepID=UPI0011260526|nr:Co2+/Mg2+ efflux protein ApaG [Aestuariibacter sp. GS-14]TPV57798.1 Co2+/Mg2+ efflux protein ApaG [Aestuariibacter sp. GS-14]
MTTPTPESVLAEQVTVQVVTRHLPEHLPSDSDKFAFAYQITISNHNSCAVTLTHRYWLVTDANGKQIEVSGEGVIGKQPTINPGESFQYTSGSVLDTKVGTMQGYYEMKTDQGEQFRVPIAPFRLALPNIIN